MVRYKRNNKLYPTLIFYFEVNSQINSFTMESLILAQDER